MNKITPFVPATATGQDITDKKGYAARWLHTPRSVDNWISDGLPCVKIGPRRVRIVIAEADAWMRERFGQQRRGAHKAERKITTVSRSGKSSDSAKNIRTTETGE
jgi:hypothetical protein